MNKEEILNDILLLKDKNICLELATGFGKSRLAIEILKNRKIKEVLVVIPRNVLIDNWLVEFKKWKYKGTPIFSTYISLPKFIGRKFEAIIYDEAHHITDRCYSAIENISSNLNIFLSATLKSKMKYKMDDTFKYVKYYKVTTQQAIDENVLPKLKIVTVPLELDNTTPCFKILLNSRGKITKRINYSDRFKYIKDKNLKLIIDCTLKQYNEYLSSKIDYYKKLYLHTGNKGIKNKWLKLCNERLKILANSKNKNIIYLLKALKKERCITFCSTIKQAEILGKNCINSNNKASSQLIEKFNKKEINHITAVNMLNEGVNLTNCKYGIFAILNSSEIMQIQKIGRLLRHKKPIIIIPYYVNTRENEILDKMLEGYNKELITTFNLKKL